MLSGAVLDRSRAGAFVTALLDGAYDDDQVFHALATIESRDAEADELMGAADALVADTDTVHPRFAGPRAVRNTTDEVAHLAFGKIDRLMHHVADEIVAAVVEQGDQSGCRHVDGADLSAQVECNRIGQA